MKDIIEMAKAADKAMDKVFTVAFSIIGAILGLCIVIGVPLIIVGACAKYLFS